MARRFRRKSSLDGLKVMKWSPASGCSEWRSRSGSDVQKNGLSSVLKSARSGIAEPLA